AGPREEPAPEQELHLPLARNGEPRFARQRTAVRQIFAYGFGDLLDDTAHWLVLGVILAAVVAVLLPPSVIEQYFGGGLVTMLAMLAIGIPIYTCASASTPIAAALVLKGLSPGAAPPGGDRRGRGAGLSREWRLHRGAGRDRPPHPLRPHRAEPPRARPTPAAALADRAARGGPDRPYPTNRGRLPQRGATEQRR